MIKIPNYKIENSLLFALSVLICLWPAFFNGFPILFQESATYILTGHITEIPLDRSFIYSFFLRHISLSWSLILVVVVQSIIINYLLWLLIKYVIKVKKVFFLHFLMILILSLISDIGIYISSIDHHVFTAISILSLLLILLIPKSERAHLIVLITLFSFASIAKYSNIPLILIALSLFLLFYYSRIKLFQFLDIKRVVASFIALGISALLLVIINGSLRDSYQLFPNRSIILFGKYLDLNIVKKYIERNCNDSNGNEEGVICNKKDYFLSAKRTDFLWGEQSTLYKKDECKENISECWKANEPAYSSIINKLIWEQDAREDIIATSIAGTFTQLLRFNQPNILPVSFEALIEKHFPANLYLYQNASQNKDRIAFNSLHFWSILTVHFSFYFLLYLFLFRRNQLSKLNAFFIAFVFICLIVNAFVNASFFTIHTKNQGSITFLLILAVMMVLIDSLKKKINHRELKLSDVL
jgi:hypothetical protein